MKCIKILGLLLFVSVISFTQSITVTSPNGGEIWKIGGLQQNITWTHPGISKGTYKITLWEGNTNLGTIAGNISYHLSSYPWTVGKLNNGTTVAAGSNYRIKIRLQGESPADFSDAPFSLTALKKLVPVSKIGNLKMKKVNPALLSTAIKILDPDTGTNWTETGTFAIKWETMLKTKFSIDLYNYNGRKKVKTIVDKVLFTSLSSSNTYQYNWTIPMGTYDWPGNFTIRISTADGKYDGFSKMFHINKAINMVEKKYTLQGIIQNRSHRHYRYKGGGLDTQGTAFPTGPEPGIMKVGYENNWRQWGLANVYHRQLCFIHRSFANFDVSNFSKNKIIKKALFHLKKISTYYSDGHTANNNDPGHCIKGLWHVDQPWSSPFEVDATQLGGIQASYDITSYVRDWALKGVNHGLMLVGIDESYGKNNASCISYYTCSLEIITLENQQ